MNCGVEEHQRNDLLDCSFTFWGSVSLLLTGLLSLAEMLCLVLEELHVITSNFASILSSATFSSVTSLDSMSDHQSREDGASNNGLIEHVEHPVASIKRPEPS